MRVGIALGSNLGGRREHLRRARVAILELPGVEAAGRHLAAPIYETAPVNCPPGAGSFLNSVIEIGYDGDPPALLAGLHGIEAARGRPRERGLNAPRPLDLDILYAGDLVLRTAELTIPHPRMFQRRFVLAPLNDLRPELILPGETRTVAALLAALEDAGADQVALAVEQW